MTKAGAVGGEVMAVSLDLFWIPLGAGGHVVRWNGRVYERWSARREHRTPADLYHCAGARAGRHPVCRGDGAGVERAADAERGALAEPVDSPVQATEDGARSSAICRP